MDVLHVATKAFVRSLSSPENAARDRDQADWPRSSMLILSEASSVRETLASALQQAFCFTDLHSAASAEEAVTKIDMIHPALVLIDVSMPSGLAAAQQLRQHDQTARLIAFNINSAIRDVAAWSQAGVVAHVGHFRVLDEIVEGIATLLAEQSAGSCSLAEPAGSAETTKGRSSGPPPVLTAREKQVARLIIAGASNKEIARALDIGVATVKSHVHNLLGKLGLAGRSKLALWYGSRQSAVDVTQRHTGW